MILSAKCVLYLTFRAKETNQEIYRYGMYYGVNVLVSSVGMITGLAVSVSAMTELVYVPGHGILW